MFVFHYHGSVVQWVLVGYQSDHKEIRLEKKILTITCASSSRFLLVFQLDSMKLHWGG